MTWMTSPAPTGTERGDTYSAAARHLANRFFGILYHCLQKRISYDEAKAFPPDIKIAT